jgi:hypothetical protein
MVSLCWVLLELENTSVVQLVELLVVFEDSLEVDFPSRIWLKDMHL